MKEGVESSVKFKKLKRRLSLPEWQAIGLLEAIWKLARVSAQDGAIGKFSNEDIAASIEYDGDADVLVTTLVECGWLDEDPEFRLIIHDWSEHVPTYLKGNFKTHGKEFADVIAKQRAKQVTKQPAKQVAEQVAISNVLPSLTQPSQAPPSPTQPSQANPEETPSSAASTPPVSVDEFFERWNRFAAKNPKLTACRKLTEKRRNKIRTRLKEPDWFDDFKEAVASLPLGGDGWQPTLDWLVENSHNAYRLLEGDFDWRNRDDPAAIRLAEQRRKNAYREREEFERCKKQRLKELSSATHKIIENISPATGGLSGETSGVSLLFGEENDSSVSGAEVVNQPSTC